MPDLSDLTAVRPPDALAVPAPRENSTTDETLVRPSSAAPLTSGTLPRATSTGSAGFAEETRLLLRKRLLITHGAIGFATAFMVLVNLFGVPVLPCEAGMGRWVVGLP